MKKHLELRVEIELVHYPGQIVLVFVLHRDALSAWTLGLCLLGQGLINELVVTTVQDPRMTVSFLLNSKTVKDSISIRDRNARINLTANSLGYVGYFFLKYFRDGVADVDHIHLEPVNAKNETIDLTFKVPDSKPPMSAEELRERLRSK